MKKYCAKTNTADPRTGFISMGEILTDAQAEALGEEKLQELVERGVLGVMGGGTETPAPKQPDPEEPEEEPEDEPEDEADADDEDEEAEDEDDLPTLDAGDVIEDEQPAKPAAKRGGRKGK